LGRVTRRPFRNSRTSRVWATVPAPRRCPGRSSTPTSCGVAAQSPPTTPSIRPDASRQVGDASKRREPASGITRARPPDDSSISRPHACRPRPPERRLFPQRSHREEGTAFSGMAKDVRLRGCPNRGEQIPWRFAFSTSSKSLTVLHH
jgi:hypothetical protein